MALAAPPTWPKRPARLGAAVVHVLVDRIVSGEFEPGALLPTEPRLCEAFSVSRTVIREAVKILEEKGLVHVRQGQGTTVAAPAEWNLLDPMVLEASVRHDKDLRVLDDLVEVRRVLESEMARQAAVKATLSDRAEMKRLLDQMAAEAVTPDDHVLTDLEFHNAIMRASGNRLGLGDRAGHPLRGADERPLQRVSRAGRLRGVQRRPARGSTTASPPPTPRARPRRCRSTSCTHGSPAGTSREPRSP